MGPTIIHIRNVCLQDTSRFRSFCERRSLEVPSPYFHTNRSSFHTSQDQYLQGPHRLLFSISPNKPWSSTSLPLEEPTIIDQITRSFSFYIAMNVTAFSHSLVCDRNEKIYISRIVYNKHEVCRKFQTEPALSYSNPWMMDGSHKPQCHVLLLQQLSGIRPTVRFPRLVYLSKFVSLISGSSNRLSVSHTKVNHLKYQIYWWHM